MLICDFYKSVTSPVCMLESRIKKQTVRTDKDYRAFKPNRGSGGFFIFFGGGKIWFFRVLKIIGRNSVLILRLVPFDALTLAK